MARVNEIFNKLVESSTITIETGNKRAHESLRIRLVKLLTRHKRTLESIGYSDASADYSLCASFDSDTKCSKFSIAPARQSSRVDFKIVTSGG